MSGPALLDIYRVRAVWRDSTYNRPGLIVRTYADGRYGCALSSTQFDLYDAAKDFCIRDAHENFAATGLAKSSYFRCIDIPMLTREDLLEHKGAMIGNLKREFEFWWGFRH